ncbi:hypothetical protein JM654_23675 [Microbacterium oxydans]|nr:hypothetical protein [Microbacterium oxydans]
MFGSTDAAAWSVQGLIGGTATLSVMADLPGTFDTGIGGNGRDGELATTLTVPARRNPARTGFVQAIGLDGSDAKATWADVAGDIPGDRRLSRRVLEPTAPRRVSTRATPAGSPAHCPCSAPPPHPCAAWHWWAALGVIWFRRDFARRIAQAVVRHAHAQLLGAPPRSSGTTASAR